MTRTWPYGMPKESAPGDRQHHEDAAFALKHSAEDKLTPTGRLRKGVQPVVFKGIVERAIAAFNALIVRYPDNADNYRRWLAETEALTVKVK